MYRQYYYHQKGANKGHYVTIESDTLRHTAKIIPITRIKGSIITSATIYCTYARSKDHARIDTTQ